MREVVFLATEGHFADHLRPVADRMGLPVLTAPPRRGRPLVVTASIGDTRKARAASPRNRLVICEHGAGQSYTYRHPSYAGGVGRDDVAAMLVPNEHAARRNRLFYPNAYHEVVGCPKLDAWAGLKAPPTDRCLAVVSFHWRCGVCPETDTAFDHFAPALRSAATKLRRRKVSLALHAHPRIAAEVATHARSIGVEFIESFDEVARRASVYAVDNSSTLFEFAFLDRPVVVLNAPTYRRDVAHGLRFWEAASIGVGVDEPTGLAAGIVEALEDPPARRAAREAALSLVYGVRDGTSAERAAGAIAHVAKHVR